MYKGIFPKKAYSAYGYKVSRHAIKRMKERSITKGEVGYNLKTKTFA